MIAKILQALTGKDDVERVAYKGDVRLLNDYLKTRRLLFPKKPLRFLDEKFPKVVDGGGWKKGILRERKKPAAVTRWRHNPQDTYGTEECSQSGKAS